MGIMDVTTKSKDLQTAEPPKVSSQRLENLKPDPTLDYSLSQDTNWQFQQIVGVLRHIATVDVTSTNVQGSYLWYHANTVRNTLALFDGTNLFNYFSYCKFKLHFYFEVQSAMQHQGALIINQLNINPVQEKMRWIGLPQGIPTDIRAMTILPHDFITLGHNGMYDISMPWNCSRNALPCNINDSGTVGQSGKLIDYDLGFLSLCIFDPLQIQAAVYGTTSVRILARLDELTYTGFKPDYTI